MKMKGTHFNIIITFVAVLVIFFFLGNARAEQDGTLRLQSLFLGNAQNEQDDQLKFEVLHTYPCALPDENGNIGGYDHMCAEIVFLDDDDGVPAAPAVVRFTIYDAELDQPIGELLDGTVLDEDDLSDFTVVAEVEGAFTNIVFNLYEIEEDGSAVLIHNHIEGQPPYRLYGDTEHGYEGHQLTEGSYELFAYGMVNGEPISTYNVTFEVTD